MVVNCDTANLWIEGMTESDDLDDLQVEAYYCAVVPHDASGGGVGFYGTTVSGTLAESPAKDLKLCSSVNDWLMFPPRDPAPRCSAGRDASAAAYCDGGGYGDAEVLLQVNTAYAGDEVRVASQVKKEAGLDPGDQHQPYFNLLDAAAPVKGGMTTTRYACHSPGMAPKFSYNF